MAIAKRATCFDCVSVRFIDVIQDVLFVKAIQQNRIFGSMTTRIILSFAILFFGRKQQNRVL